MPHAPASPDPGATPRRAGWPPVLIVLATLAAYHGSFSGPLVFDDIRSIVDNASIRHLSLAALAPPPSGLTVSGRPVLNLSLALNYALSGTAVWSYHAVNLLIHLLAALVLYGIVRRTLVRLVRATGSRIEPVPCACAAALLWALHPLQTEAVLYVIQRAESLMALFYLLTLYCFIRGVEADGAADSAAPGIKPSGGGSPAWLGLAWLACLLGMGTKEVTVSAPFLVLLYDRTFVAGTVRAAWDRRRGFYLALAATWIPLCALVAAGGGNRGGTSGFGIGVAWWAYGLTQFQAVARYLWLSVWPASLAIDYGPYWVKGAGEVVPYALVIVPLAAATVWAVLRPAGELATRAAGYAGVWFFAILAPTSLLPGGIQMIAEHRMYLPLAAVIAVAVVAIRAVVGRRPGLILLVLAAVALGVATDRRAAVYRSELSLWGDTAAKRPGNAFAQNNLGKALFLEGRVAEAEARYARAIELDPGDAQARYNLANILAGEGRMPEAIAQYRAALALDGRLFEAHNNLGLALAKAGRPGEAIAEFEATLRLQPDSLEAHSNLADLLAEAGRIPESVAHYEAALRIEPSAAVHENLAMALAQEGQVAEAIVHFEAAVRLAPGDPELHYNLGLALGHVGRTEEARVQLEAAARLRPGNGVEPGRP